MLGNEATSLQPTPTTPPRRALVRALGRVLALMAILAISSWLASLAVPIAMLFGWMSRTNGQHLGALLLAFGAGLFGILGVAIAINGALRLARSRRTSMMLAPGTPNRRYEATMGAGSLVQGGIVATLGFLVAAQFARTGRVDSTELAWLTPTMLGLWVVNIIVSLLAWRLRRDGRAPH